MKALRLWLMTIAFWGLSGFAAHRAVLRPANDGMAIFYGFLCMAMFVFACCMTAAFLTEVFVGKR